LSHMIEIKTEVLGEAAVRAACTRLTRVTPEHKTCRLFSATAMGLCVQLPGWNYAVEKAKIEAHRKGHTCSETRLEDGSIHVTVRVGGAA